MKIPIPQKLTLLIFAILVLVCVPQRAVYAAPSFILPATTRTVAENTPPGTNIGAPVSATGTTNLDRYILAETDDHPNDYLSFDIDPLTGQIKTKAPLDYETKTTYKLSVTVQEGEMVNGELVLSNRSNIVVTINVTDVSGAFPVNSVTFSIAENTAADMNIGDPISAEPDTSSPYEYRLVGTDASHFTLDRLGVGNTSSDNTSRSSQLQTKGALNYEAKNSYSVTLQFFTGTWVGLSVTWNASPEDTISITINVENKNEAPAFSSSTATIQIPESTSANADIGSPIIAMDPDITSSNTDANPETADANAVAYSLSGTTDAPNDYESFAIDAATGQLKVAENVDLDYDEKNSYTFIVTASDGTLNDTIEVTIELQDVVHAPLFISDMGETITEASFKIEEDSPPGTDVGYALRVRIDDDNATVTYSLSAHDDAPDDYNSFTLNSDGQLKVADNVRLDYETKTEYKVNVTASDGTHSTTIPVTINVTNIELKFINESSSVLSNPTTVHVDEGVPRGTKIAGPYRVNELSEVIFTYEGRSTPENMNDHLSFNREKSSNEDGERVWYIIAEEPLDYESKNQYILRMRVQIVGKAESHTVRLIINIRDVNDNRPVFTDGVRATRSIVENTPSGEPIGEPIEAMDDDAGTTITYALQAHPDAPSDVNAFTIDTGTGQLRTNAALDYETKTVYLVTVTATDDDPNDPNDTFRTTSIPVTINVTDAVPTFIEADPASRSVAENTARGTNIGNPVSATAPDIGETLTYSLVMDTDTSPNYDWFDIDPATGQLKVKGALNYEQKTSYTVVVAVSIDDNTEPSDTITVNISVTNEIEGRPAFRGDTSRSVDENVPIGTLVGIPIEFINLPGTFTYSVTGTDRTAFSIDGNAQLKTNTTLDFESKSSYSINVNVQWTPVDVVQTESVEITVNVNNKNEAPMFADETTIRTVPTTANDGTSLGAPLTAVDPDITSSNTDANPETVADDALEYSLSGTHAVLFELDSDKPGQLIAKRPSALTAGTTYNVIVTVSDGGLSDTIAVDITATGMPTVLITLPTDEQDDTKPQTGTFDVRIRFSESVTGFAASDITLTLTLTEGSGTATATLVDANAGDMDYTARISLPNNAEGSLVISVPAGVATNEKNVGNTASAEYTVPIDTKHPTYSTPSLLAVTRTGPFRTTITFSEPVKDFTPDDVSTSNCQITALTDLTGERTNYLVTITPTASGNASFTIELNKVHDDAGNGNSNQPIRGVTVALGNPNVTISAPTTSQSAPFDITITFSEIVTGFTASDISLGGTATGIVTNFMENNINYTATVTPSTSGDLEISVPANVAFDDADNSNNASSTKTVPVTVTGPTVTITGVPTTSQNSSFTITITFSEAVTGFEVGDISLGDNVSATVKSFSGSGTTYTAEITPADNVEEDVTISVPTGVALNVSSVANNTSPGYTVRLDKVGPSVTITGPPETTATTLFGMPFDVTFEFHEAVTEFDVGDISLGGNATATVGNFMTVSGTTYTATITPTTEGFVLVTAQANTAKDAASNRNAATSSRFSVDPTRPVVTITDLPTAVQTSAFEGTFGFDDAVTGFDADDITLSGTVNATLTLNETSSAVYEMTITPEEDVEGNVIISVAENVAENAAGLGNTALATAVTVPVDTLHPEVRIKNVPGMATMGGFVVTFEFTEAVTGFEASDISLSGTATATVNNFTPERMTESNRKYTANIIPSTTGNLKISVPADRAVDAANNGNIASSAHTVTITNLDTTPPTVSVTARSAVLDNPQNENFDVAITFSEPVIGFRAGDISLTLELTEGTGTATTDIREVTRYIAVIKPPDDVEGVIKISVPAEVATDASNNDNTASNVLTVRIDRKTPNVETIGVPTTPQNSEFDVKITFDEPVSSFTVDDISMTQNLTEGTGTATVRLSGNDGDSEYTLTITPPADVEGDIKISVPANAVVDTANNGNTVSSEYTALIDTIRPTTMITDLPLANDPQNGAFNVRIEFSEPVTGLEKTDIALTVNNVNATVTAVTETTDMGMSMDPVVSGTAYIATVTPTGQSTGKVSVRVPENVAEDAAGNGNEASLSSHDVTVDTKPPEIDSITVPTAANGAFDITITFTDDVTDFDDLTDVTFHADSTATATVTRITGSGKTYTVNITPMGNGDLIIQVPADAAKDTAGNGNEASDSYTVLIDTTSPQVSTLTVPNTAGAAFNVNITFSEDVTDFDDLTDIVFGGDSTATATVTSITGSGKTYTANITPTGDGNLIVQVPAGAAKDTAGNGNTASGTHTVTISLTGSSVAITDVPTTPQNSAFDVKITFSESVTEFVASDISLGTGVSATVSLTGSGAEYTATITPATNTEEDIILSVPAGVAKNSTNITNTASSEYAIRLDTAQPLLTIRDAPANAGGAFIVIATFDIEIKFNETVVGVEKGDITFSGTASAGASVTDLTGEGSEYTATIKVTTAGNLTISVPANAAQDTAGNGSRALPATFRPTVQVVLIPLGFDDAASDTTRTIAENPNEGMNIGDALSATDADGDTLAYNLSAHDDDTDDYLSFTIDIMTGQLKARDQAQYPLNYEVQSSYKIKVEVTDGTNTASINVTVNITDVNEAPIFPATTDTTLEIEENTAGGTDIGDPLAATDPDTADDDADNTDVNPEDDNVDALTYSLVDATDPNADAAAFAIDSGTGQLKTKNPLDYETKNEYRVTVKVSDGALEDEIDVTISITDVEMEQPNNAPTFPVTETGTRSIPENTDAGTNIGAAVSADDMDTGDTLTYSLKAHTDDADDFQTFDIVNTSGQLKTKTGVTLDYETQSTYKITVQVSDGTATASIDVTISVTNVNETPEFPADTTTSSNISESATGGTVIGTIAAEDPDIAGTNTDANPDTATADSLSYSLSGTTAAPNDYQSFTIENTANGGQLKLKTGTTLDYDTKSAYTVKVTASDGTATASIDITINVVEIPSVSITAASAVTDNPQNGAFNVTITFSESVTGFAASDISLTTTLTEGTGNATVSNLTGSGTTYTATITPPANAEGTVKISVPAGAAVDSNSQGNAASSEFTVAIDTKAPGVTITNVPTTTQSSAFTVTITFGEAVTGFAASDITLGGTATASVTSLTGSGTTYIATITPMTNGSVSIQVPAGAAEDAAGNENTQSQSHSVTFTTETSPVATTLEIVSGNGQSGRAGQQLTNPLVVEVKNQNGDPLPGVTVEFSTAFDPDTGRSFGSVNPTTDVTDADGQASTRFTLGSTAGVYTVTASATIINVSYSVTFTANVIGTIDRKNYSVRKVTSDPINIHYGESVDITVKVSPTPDKDTSAAQYVNFYLGSFAEGLSFDNTFKVKVPGSINLYTYQTNSDGEATARLNVALDAEIPDLEPNVPGKSFKVMVDFLVDNVNGTQFLSDGTSEGISPDPISFTVRVTEPETLEGQAVEDNSGEVQGGQPQTVVSEVETVEVDTDAPDVSISGFPSGVQTGAFEVTVTFTEAVTGFAREDLSVTGTANAIITAWVSYPGNTTYTAMITPTISGKVVLNIAAGVATDAANNPNTASETQTIIIQIPPPIPEPSTWMPDVNLRTAVQTSLSLVAGETLTQTKMANLTELKAAGRSISDITGIEHATNLTIARLANNQISSISLLSGLTTLTKLRLQNNQISDVSALSGLTNLTQLFLNNNQITNITPLGGLVNLETLHLAENPFVNAGANAETLNTLRAAGATIDIPAVNGAPASQKGISHPNETLLLPNYPNPFNPETWIPYQLSKSADVSLTIYNMRGIVVREIRLGHQAVGVYRSRVRAIHWDGRNAFGEKVVSGVYLYTLTAGDFTATRKLMIRK